MSDTLMAIIGIFLAVILMFIFPVVEFSGKNDELSQTVVEVVASDFVNTVTKQGKITQSDYDKLLQKLSATGNLYEVEIEVRILDDNPRRATVVSSRNMAGEYKYYSVYTKTILEKLNNGEDYLLKTDDYVVVNVKNTSRTIGTQFKNIFYNLVGKDTYTIGTSVSALVINGS